MKFLLSLAGIAIAAALGYYAEPGLRPTLMEFTKVAESPAPEISEALPEATVESPAPDPLPTAAMETPPETVAPPVGESEEPPVVQEAPPEPAPAPASTPELGPELATETAEATSPVTPIDPISPIEGITPQATTPEQPVSAGITLMQESIRDGQITEFKFEQVKEWKDEAEEVIDGQTYQTGVITYEAETFLGMKMIQAKALMKDGKVVKWVGLKSGIEIK